MPVDASYPLRSRIRGQINVILAVALLVVTTAAIATIWLAPRLGRNRFIYELKPDGPHGFGCEMSWIAILSTDTEAVLDALMLEGEAASNWNNGIGTVYDHWLGPERAFVTPPVDGWTFVVSLALPHPVGFGYVDKCTPLLSALARRFVDVQYFFSYPPLDFYSWVRFRDGQLVRAFASTDQGAIWSRGRQTRAEQSLGLKFYEFRGVRGRSGDTGSEILMSPTEEHVMQIARAWSRDPTALTAADGRPGLGYVTPAPKAWRTERVRKKSAA